MSDIRGAQSLAIAAAFLATDNLLRPWLRRPTSLRGRPGVMVYYA